MWTTTARRAAGRAARVDHDSTKRRGAHGLFGPRPHETPRSARNAKTVRSGERDLDRAAIQTVPQVPAPGMTPKRCSALLPCAPSARAPGWRGGGRHCPRWRPTGHGRWPDVATGVGRGPIPPGTKPRNPRAPFACRAFRGVSRCRGPNRLCVSGRVALCPDNSPAADLFVSFARFRDFRAPDATVASNCHAPWRPPGMNIS